MANGFIGELRVLQRLNKFEFGVEIRVMRSGVNRNRWNYQNVEQHFLSFVGQPILCAFPKNKIGDGHNCEEATDPDTGEKYYSFLDGSCERIVGTLSNDPKDFRLVDEDGEKWLIAKGRLFTFYARELVENIIKIGIMEVSAETVVHESYEENGNEVFTDWEGLGVTILGEGVAPAIPGARVEELAAMKEEFNQLCLRAASYIGEEEEEKEEEPIAEEQNNKPHNNEENPNGGVKKLKAFTKKQIAELQTRFDGFRVLSAVKDESEIHVCLMSEDGNTAIYNMTDVSETIVPEKIVKCATQTNFTFNEECVVAVDSDELIDTMSATIVTANARIKDLEDELATANDTIRVMTENEKARRIKAAKDCAVNTLDKFNAYREAKVENDVLVAVNTAIDNGEYTDCVTAEGEWDGEKRVETAVLAACAVKTMEMDKATRQVYVWENGGNGHSDSVDDVEGLLSSFGIN